MPGRNLFAVTAASFIGFTGFTLVMPFLPLFIRQLGVTDVGEIALWAGAILGVTPALTAVLSPFWGRLADRYGRKIMVIRSLVSCSLVMAAMAFVTHPWHVLALRAVLGLFTGYGGLTLTMAAESAPRERMASAIGLVQTAQRLGPAVGPVIGGVLAGSLGLRPAFLATAALYGIALLLVIALYDERETLAARRDDAEPAGAAGVVPFRSVLAFEHFVLFMGVIFGLQFVDRSIGPILPLYLEEVGVGRPRVAVTAGVLFTMAALAGSAGHHFSGWLLGRASPRTIIGIGASASAAGAALLSLGLNVWLMGVGMAIFGVGAGVAMTTAYTAAGTVMPAGARGTGFGMLSSASLTGSAVSPVIAGLLGAASMRGVFILDMVVMAVLAGVVRRVMAEGEPLPQPLVGDAGVTGDA